MGIFSVLALSLASVGVYGVLAFTVGERAREIAVRRALGAGAGSVARSVVWEGVRMAVLGLVVGGGVALLAGRWMEALLFQVEPADPVTLAAVAGLMLAVVLLAASVPAWRATRREPAEALAAE
jgi:ABC-type lipoprotein release transport system permease subunit